MPANRLLQKKIIKEAILDDMIEDVLSKVKGNYAEAKRLITLASSSQFLDKFVNGAGEEIISLQHIQKLYRLGSSTVKNLFGDEVPSESEFTAICDEIINESLNVKNETNETKDKKIDVMPEIRKLVVAYFACASKDWENEVSKRMKIAHEIALLRIKGKIPSYYSMGKILDKPIVPSIDDPNYLSNINNCYAPGDFSNLDLSYLELVEPTIINAKIGGQRSSNLAGLFFKGSNLRGSVLAFSTYGADLSLCDLRAVDFSNIETKNFDAGFLDDEKPQQMPRMHGADIQNAYFGRRYKDFFQHYPRGESRFGSPGFAAKNFDMTASTPNQLTTARAYLRKMDGLGEEIKSKSESINTQTTDENFQKFKKLYYQEYNACFFKNPWSSMKTMLDDPSFNSMDLVYAYAEKNPDSRTATLLKRKK